MGVLRQLMQGVEGLFEIINCQKEQIQLTISKNGELLIENRHLIEANKDFQDALEAAKMRIGIDDRNISNFKDLQVFRPSSQLMQCIEFNKFKESFENRIDGLNSDYFQTRDKEDQNEFDDIIQTIQSDNNHYTDFKLKPFVADIQDFNLEAGDQSQQQRQRKSWLDQIELKTRLQFSNRRSQYRDSSAIKECVTIENRPSTKYESKVNVEELDLKAETLKIGSNHDSNNIRELRYDSETISRDLAKQFQDVVATKSYQSTKQSNTKCSIQMFNQTYEQTEDLAISSKDANNQDHRSDDCLRCKMYRGQIDLLDQKLQDLERLRVETADACFQVESAYMIQDQPTTQTRSNGRIGGKEETVQIMPSAASQPMRINLTNLLQKYQKNTSIDSSQLQRSSSRDQSSSRYQRRRSGKENLANKQDANNEYMLNRDTNLQVDLRAGQQHISTRANSSRSSSRSVFESASL